MLTVHLRYLIGIYSPVNLACIPKLILCYDLFQHWR